MAEYIKRETAVKIAKKYDLTSGFVLRRHTGIADCIAREINSIHAADVAPVVHGRWEDTGKQKDTWTCSACGAKVGAFLAGCSAYCYHCGAKMDGGTT